MKLEIQPKCLPIKNSGITFQSWKSSTDSEKLHWLIIDKNPTFDKYIQELGQLALRLLGERDKIYNAKPKTL